MLSKTQNKYIRSLTHQKSRSADKVFIAEGAKIAEEWLRSQEPVHIIIATESWLASHAQLVTRHPSAQLHVVTETELASVSALQTANQVLLVVGMPDAKPLPPITEWCLALDTIQDPGNMGTIIRIADWFGINHIVCAPGCVDIYNPKVVQSAMGGHLRVNIYEAELAGVLSAATIPVIAATLDGENVYNAVKPQSGILVIGNESRGISGNLLEIAKHRVMIPRRGGAESLNAGVSTGILCALYIQPI